MVSILEKINEMEEYAGMHNVPIMQKESIDQIKGLIDTFHLYEI